MEINVAKVWFENGNIFVRTIEGITKSHPLSWFPRLQRAPQALLENFTLSPFGIHWEELDEDLSFQGFFYYKPENTILQKNK